MLNLEPLPMEGAQKFWADKIKLSPGEFNKLSDEAKLKAFSVSGIAKGAELETVFDAIQNAIDKGTTFADFKKDAGDIFEKRGWTGPRTFRAETIFRTNIQTAYSVGRYTEMMAVSKTRPYWQYHAVNDSRTRPTHAALNGKVFRYDNEFWDKWYPPNGFNCRCTVTTLSQDDVDSEGIEVGTKDPTYKLIEPVDPVTGNKLPARALIPDKGFDFNPGKAYWEIEAALGERVIAFSDGIKTQVVNDIAKTELRKPVFSQWIDDVLSEKLPKGSMQTAGWIDGYVLKFLSEHKIEVKNPVIIENDKRVFHAQRETKIKKGSALTIEELKNIPDYISNYEAVLWDKEDPALLYVVTSADKKIKSVIRVNYVLKGQKEPVNLIVTASKVKTEDLKVKRYEIIRGRL